MFNMKKNITLIMLSIALFTGFNSLLFAEKNKEKSMPYVGKWVFHSIMSMDESGKTTFLNAEEYLNTLPDFIDKNNTAAVEEKRRCTVCGSPFASKSNHAKYCPDCRKKITRKQAAERMRKKRSLVTK